jgi:short-subunit dehydrogenase
MTELLKGKTAIIYGGGDGIGGGVARTFAREGGKVFLVGRTRDKLDTVAQDITSAGGDRRDRRRRRVLKPHQPWGRPGHAAG